jgi:hypothetical protein
MTGQRSARVLRAASTTFVCAAVAVVAFAGAGRTATHVTTIGVARPESSNTKLGWHLRTSNTSGGANIHLTFGNPKTGFPIVGDWNGDGIDTIGLVRNDGYNHLEWHLRNTNTTGGANVHFTFGSVLDFPVVGDWNGDGKDTIGIVRDDTLGNLEWNLRNSNTNGGADLRFTYGSSSTGFPVAGDWNG